MKTLFIFIFIVLLVIPTVSLAKDIDISVTGAIGYGHAKWGSGEAVQPGGTLEKSAVIYNPAIQIKYNKWAFQPTLELNYRWTKYDFSTWQALVQKMEPRAWSFLLGLTKDFNFLYAYALVGMTFYDANPSLLERHPPLYHGTNIGIESTLFTYKVGAYKLWKVGPLEVGPEVSLQGWGIKPGFSRCREGKENIIQPNIGIRVQW